MKDLKAKFVGTRSVKGFVFTQIKGNGYAYLYEVRDDEYGNIWYEVFERKVIKARDAVLGDAVVHFDEKVVYPNDDCFGKTAWTCMTLGHANHVFDRITKICKGRIK